MKKQTGFTFIELAIVICIIGILIALFVTLDSEKNEKAEFIEYCQTKGNTAEDCKWEWKRIKNGEKSNMIIVPVRF